MAGTTSARRRARVLWCLVGTVALLCVSTAASTGASVGASAASSHGWGRPSWREEFNGSRLGGAWGVFDGPGNGGNGLRRPSQVSTAGGMLTITGTADALTGGIALDRQVHPYGRWEARLRTNATGPGRPYHAVLALIPHDPDAYHCGANDVDFAEYDLGSRVGFFLHGMPDRQDYAFAGRDTTRWHTYAVEVTRHHVSWFIDGRAIATDRDASMVSGLPMALDIQLDAVVPGGLAPATMQVAWARYYPAPRHERAVRARAPRRSTYGYAC